MQKERLQRRRRGKDTNSESPGIDPPAEFDAEADDLNGGVDEDDGGEDGDDAETRGRAVLVLRYRRPVGRLSAAAAAAAG